MKRTLKIIIVGFVGIVLAIFVALFIFFEVDNWMVQHRVRTIFGMSRGTAITEQTLRAAAGAKFPVGTPEAEVRARIGPPRIDKKFGISWALHKRHNMGGHYPGLDLPPGNYLECSFDSERGFPFRVITHLYFQMDENDRVKATYLWNRVIAP